MHKSLLFSIFAVFLFACKSDSPESQIAPELRISGQIKNTPDNTVIIANGEAADTLSLDGQGQFSALVSLEAPSTLRLIIGKESTLFFGAPGDSLFVQIDFSSFDESITYSGSSPDGSNLLAELYLLNEKINNELPIAQLYQLNPARFLEVSDSVKLAKSAIIAKYQEKIHPTFKTEQELAISYDWARNVSVYPEYAAWFQKNDSLEIPENFMASIADVPVENPSALKVPAYERYIQEKIQAEMNRRFEKKGIEPEEMDYMNEMLLTTDSLFSNQEVKDHFLKSSMSQVISYFGTRDLSDQFDFYTSHSSNASDLEMLKTEYASWSHLQPGKKAPEFGYKTMEDELVQLSDFKGKLVYVDVWATWCGPCRGEIPSLQIMEEEMKDEEVVFLSVSVDDSYEVWENMVTEDQLGGIQVITGTGWKSKITEDYKINGIPRFLLIGRDGMIVSADAPRPSDHDRLKSMMMDALNQGTALAVNP